ncbi:MAG: sulfurtransferase TusA family protein [Anaerolineales bacterium]
MTSGIGNAVGVRRTETCLIIWDSQPASEEVSSVPEASMEAHHPKGTVATQIQTDSISKFGADAFYDAGDQGCGEGPLDKIAVMMRKLEPNQTLEVRATDPSVAVDLPAWCRMTNCTLLKQEGDRYLIQRS